MEQAPAGQARTRQARCLVAWVVLAVLALSPIARAQRAWFDMDLPAAVQTRTAPSGQLLVRPTLDGIDLGWFVLDTGASVNVITPAARKKLTPTRVGETRSEDITGHEIVSANWQVGTLTLGRMTIPSARFTEVELSHLTRHWGFEVAGLLGHDTFMHAVIELDLAAVTVGIFDPRWYELADDSSWDRLDLRGRVPHVQATFEGRTRRFFLDTGDGASVTFHAPAVSRYRLLRDRKTTSRTIKALRGSIEYRYGTIKDFELGGHTFTDLAAAFTPKRSGVYLERYDAGRIGVGVLRPFRIVLDYPNRRIAMTERPIPVATTPSREPLPTPRSDLLDAYTGTYQLADGSRRRVWHDGKHLLTQRPDGPVLIARVEADDRFVYESLGIPGRFERDKNGAITAMVLYYPGEDPERAQRTDTNNTDPP